MTYVSWKQRMLVSEEDTYVIHYDDLFPEQSSMCTPASSKLFTPQEKHTSIYHYQNHFWYDVSLHQHPLYLKPHITCNQLNIQVQVSHNTFYQLCFPVVRNAMTGQMLAQFQNILMWMPPISLTHIVSTPIHVIWGCMHFWPQDISYNQSAPH